MHCRDLAFKNLQVVASTIFADLLGDEEEEEEDDNAIDPELRDFIADDVEEGGEGQGGGGEGSDNDDDEDGEGVKKKRKRPKKVRYG